METVPIFDWLRWVEVPIWLGMIGWLIAHIRHDAVVETRLAEAIGTVKTLQGTVATLLEHLLERNSNG